MREGLPQISHPISHRTPEYRMGKDSIRLLAAIKKRLNFQTQRDRKIQGKINSNSLGNRRLSYRRGEVWNSFARDPVAEANGRLFIRAARDRNRGPPTPGDCGPEANLALRVELWVTRVVTEKPNKINWVWWSEGPPKRRERSHASNSLKKCERSGPQMALQRAPALLRLGPLSTPASKTG